MAAPVALSPSIPFDYVLADNRKDPEADQTKFECRTLTGRARLRIQQILTRTMPLDLVALKEWDPKASEMVAVAEQALIDGLVGWRDFRDDAGKEVKYPGDARQALELLHELVAQEIGTEIWTKSKVTPEKKES